jgi:deaminated glutathione amidase
MRIAMVQMNATEDKAANVAKALKMVDEAAAAGADVVVLPEYLDYLGRGEGVQAASEDLDGPTSAAFADAAASNGMWVLAGSIHERSRVPGKCHNTLMLFDRSGRRTAVYRKTHLYDVDLPGRIVYRESSTVVPGDGLVTAQIDGVTVGLSICYDLRFPELYRRLTAAGAKVLFVPSAFQLITGRDHWELLLRARAVENQAYVVGVSQIGPYEPNGVCNGRSMTIDPWGVVLACAPDRECVVVSDLDLEYLETVRTEMPIADSVRPDVYGAAVTGPVEARA